MSSSDEDVAESLEAFVDERSDPSYDGIFVSVPTVVGNNEGDCDLECIPRDSCPGHEQGHTVLSNI